MVGAYVSYNKVTSAVPTTAVERTSKAHELIYSNRAIYNIIKTAYTTRRETTRRLRCLANLNNELYEEILARIHAFAPRKYAYKTE